MEMCLGAFQRLDELMKSDANASIIKIIWIIKKSQIMRSITGHSFIGTIKTRAKDNSPKICLVNYKTCKEYLNVLSRI